MNGIGFLTSTKLLSMKLIAIIIIMAIVFHVLYTYTNVPRPIGTRAEVYAINVVPFCFSVGLSIRV